MLNKLPMLLALALLGGCAGSGDYAVYRVAFGTPYYSNDCYQGEEIPPDIANDTTTFLSSDTLAVFRGYEDSWYLEFGDQILEGSEDKGAYSFTGETVDVEVAGEGVDATTTLIDDIVLTMESSGDQVSGDVESSETLSCAGVDCPEEFGRSCSVTVDFVGTRVDDVQLYLDF